MASPTIRAISDQHGDLPEIEPCDILLVGGDVAPDFFREFYRGNDQRIDKGQQKQSKWLDKEYREWLESLPARHIVGIAGNHDFVFEHNSLIPDNLPWTYLKDEEVEIEGVRIFGTPWVPNLPSWAFHRGMNSVCSDWAYIPEGIDILLSHGPMYGYGDNCTGYGPVGCHGMRDAMKRIQPKVFVCGHIHEGRGHFPHRDIELGVYNVSYMDENYDPQGGAVEIPWEAIGDSETANIDPGAESASQAQ